MRRLIDIPEVVDETLGFHAQQAVEKLIKAVLVRNGVAYDRTHNIAYLLTLLDGAGVDPQRGRGSRCRAVAGNCLNGGRR